MNKYIALLAISIATLTLSSTLQAKTHYMLANCMKSDNICSDDTQKRREASRAARWHANKYKGAGSFKFILQSDSDKTVIEYTFSYFQGHDIFEGPDGHDMYFPVTEVYLTREQRLSGMKKEAAEWLVSPNYNAKLLLQKTNIQSRNGTTIDMDEFCGERASTRRPKTILVDCRTALEDAGIFDYVGDTYQISLRKMGALTGSISTALTTPVTSVEASVIAEKSYEDAIKITRQFGKPIPVVSSDGYRMTLVPMPNGKIVVERFVVPPGTEVKLDQDGNITNEKDIIKNIEAGNLQFNDSSRVFVELMAARSRFNHWRVLSNMLENSIPCDFCKVTDNPKRKK